MQCDLLPSVVTRGWLHALLWEFPTFAFHVSVTNPYRKVSPFLYHLDCPSSPFASGFLPTFFCPQFLPRYAATQSPLPSSSCSCCKASPAFITCTTRWPFVWGQSCFRLHCQCWLLRRLRAPDPSNGMCESPRTHRVLQPGTGARESVTTSTCCRG